MDHARRRRPRGWPRAGRCPSPSPPASQPIRRTSVSGTNAWKTPIAFEPPPTQAMTASGSRPVSSQHLAARLDPDDRAGSRGPSPGTGAGPSPSRCSSACGSTVATQSRNASLIASLRVAAAGLHRDHLGAEHPHPGHVERLPPGVVLAHVDDAVQAEQRAGGRGGDAVLARRRSRRSPGVLPIRRVSSAWPSTLLILCEPVCARSSRLSRTRQPPGLGGEPRHLGEQRRPARVVAQEVGRARPGRPGPPWRRGRRRSARRAPPSAPRARTARRSGRSDRRHRALRPAAWSGATAGAWQAFGCCGCAGRRSSAVAAQRRVRTGGHQVGDGRPRVLAGHQALADQHRVGAGGGVGEQVVRPADAGLGDLDDRRRGSAGRAARRWCGRPRAWPGRAR